MQEVNLNSIIRTADCSFDEIKDQWPSAQIMIARHRGSLPWWPPELQSKLFPDGNENQGDWGIFYTLSHPTRSVLIDSNEAGNKLLEIGSRMFRGFSPRKHETADRAAINEAWRTIDQLSLSSHVAVEGVFQLPWAKFLYDGISAGWLVNVKKWTLVNSKPVIIDESEDGDFFSTPVSLLKLCNSVITALRHGGMGDGPEWIRFSEAQKLTDVNRGVIQRAADAGDIKDNGQTGDARRIELASFMQWHNNRANR